MIDIREAVYSNEKEAKALLKEKGVGMLICQDIGEICGDEPYVLVDLGDGEIRDYLVMGVNYDEVADCIMMKLQDNNWYVSTEALGYTDNNLYEYIVANI